MPASEDDAQDTAALRRRFMIAAVRLAQDCDPAGLDERDLFDLFAAIGEPDFDAWRGHVAEYVHRTTPVAANPSTPRAAAAALTHREFDARLRRERAVGFL
ncbi:MAG: hypothetical protein ACREJ2_18230 [Planctomycetota bacterium]